MPELDLPIERAALRLVELRSDVVREGSVGSAAFRGVRAAQVEERRARPGAARR